MIPYPMHRVWYINGDDNPVAVCFYCNRSLDSIHDYSCIDCGRLTCDNDCEVCDGDDCELVTCRRCMGPHLQTEHPLRYASPSSDFPICG